MNLEFILKLIMPLVLVACLIIGYLMKMYLPSDNKYIPTTLAIVGAVLGCISTWSITLEVIVGGAISGLASTGLHQMFKQILKLDKTEEVKNFKDLEG